jgi:glycosyltransferase-like protein LARGE
MDTQKKAFVVASFGVFEGFEQKTPIVNVSTVQFPETKKKLLELWDNEVIEPVHFAKFKRGHYPTNYTHWRTAKQVYSIKWWFQYEPYIIVQTKDTPLYSQVFLERFHDKASHLLHLNAAGFQFWGIADSYMVHMPHRMRQEDPAGLNLRMCASEAAKMFRKEIEMKYQKPQRHS